MNSIFMKTNEDLKPGDSGLPQQPANQLYEAKQAQQGQPRNRKTAGATQCQLQTSNQHCYPTTKQQPLRPKEQLGSVAKTSQMSYRHK